MYYWCDILIKVLKVMNQAAYIIGGYNTRHDSFSAVHVKTLSCNRRES